MASLAKATSAERIAVSGECPDCGAAALQGYKVLSVGGWFDVVKRQQRLVFIEPRPWRRLGYVHRNSPLALELAPTGRLRAQGAAHGA